MYTFINSMETVEVAQLLNNINNLVFIVAIMVSITMIFVCVFAFHLTTSINETKKLIKEQKEAKKPTRQVKPKTEVNEK